MIEITMQDVRLFAGEGKLSAADVLCAVNAFLAFEARKKRPAIEIDRRYLLSEIDDLRTAILLRHYEKCDSWDVAKLRDTVEAELRTLMMAGMTAADFKSSEGVTA